MNTALKSQLRAQLKARRTGLSASDQTQWSRAACEQFFAHVPLEPTDIIAGYWPSESQRELDCRLLLEMLEETGHTLCLPRVTARNGPLAFHRYQRNDPLVVHRDFPIQEPSKKRKQLTPNVLIIPLLAVDRDGFRLGYGGGFYDRTIKQLHANHTVNKRLLTVGIGYDFQLIDTLPRDVHDERLDVVVTDKQVVVVS